MKTTGSRYERDQFVIPIIELIKTGIWGEQFNAAYYNAYLFVYNPQRNSSIYLGVIHSESQTGNSGAPYVPYAIRGDNKAIILDAWMADKYYLIISI